MLSVVKSGEACKAGAAPVREISTADRTRGDLMSGRGAHDAASGVTQCLPPPVSEPGCER